MVLVAVVFVLVGGGYYYWKTKMQKSPAEQAVDNLQQTLEGTAQEGATKGTVPVTDTAASANAAASVPDANPYSNTNPFSDIKVNPFQ